MKCFHRKHTDVLLFALIVYFVNNLPFMRFPNCLLSANNLSSTRL